MSRGAIFEDIPLPEDRGGGLGTVTYAEWCYTIGMFQSFLFHNLPERPIRMLDVGSGAGRLYLAMKPYLTASDSYTGIDVNAGFIQRCKRLYHAANVQFIHTEASNGYYAGETAVGPRQWVFPDASFNFVTALSVWTHLREEDWRHYLSEVHRVLEPGGRAVISFFITDEDYRPELKRDRQSDFYPQNERKWIFDTPAYDSTHWKTLNWASVPEVAIAVDKPTFEQVVDEIGLKVRGYHSGQWKDHPGFFFQDVVVFEKPAG